MTLKYIVFITFKNSGVSNSERKVMALEGRRLVAQALEISVISNQSLFRIPVTHQL